MILLPSMSRVLASSRPSRYQLISRSGSRVMEPLIHPSIIILLSPRLASLRIQCLRNRIHRHTVETMPISWAARLITSLGLTTTVREELIWVVPSVKPSINQIKDNI